MTASYLSDEHFHHFRAKQLQAERTIQDTRSLVQMSLEGK